MRDDPLLEIAHRLGAAVRRTQQAQVIGQVEGEASIPLAERLDAEPHHLAGREEPIEVGGLVALDARRQNLAFELGGRQGSALQLLDGVEQRVESGATPHDALP